MNRDFFENLFTIRLAPKVVKTLDCTLANHLLLHKTLANIDDFCLLLQLACVGELLLKLTEALPAARASR